MSPFKLQRLIEQALSANDLEKARSLLRKFEREHPGSYLLGVAQRMVSAYRQPSSREATIRSHYDNLKVARNAPIEVIRAAYRTLAQKYHPDRNPGDSEAARIMQIINSSYDALSDPTKREQHDRWIDEQERAMRQAQRPAQPPRSSPPQPPPRPSTRPQASGGDGWLAVVAHVFRNWLIYGFAAFWLWVWVTDEPHKVPPGPKAYQSTPPAAQPKRYVRPLVAPNGEVWPTKAGYVKGYQRLNVSGYSVVTVDNTRNDADVFVKLVSLDGARAYPVRQFFIPAFSTFVLNNVTAGRYDVRYRDLESGALSRSEAFVLEELPTFDGVQYSTITMTLYKVQHGNMQTYRLSEAEF